MFKTDDLTQFKTKTPFPIILPQKRPKLCILKNETFVTNHLLHKNMK